MPLTPRAKASLVAAETAARDLGHKGVRCEHLILGLFSLQAGVAFVILARAGCTVDLIRAAITSSYSVEASTTADPSGCAAYDALLIRASEEAKRLGHTYTGTEHLLLALLDGASAGASQVFASLGLDTRACRHQIVDSLSSMQI